MGTSAKALVGEKITICCTHAAADQGDQQGTLRTIGGPLVLITDLSLLKGDLKELIERQNNVTFKLQAWMWQNRTGTIELIGHVNCDCNLIHGLNTKEMQECLQRVEEEVRGMGCGRFEVRALLYFTQQPQAQLASGASPQEECASNIQVISM
jgi:hypothetical protein